jgi:membrane-associated phospholipid phosphatase
MSRASEPFWGWPGWKQLQFAGLISLVGLIWFLLVFGGCDAITAYRATRVRVHFDAELRIPFVPAASLIYMSIYALFLAAPFVVRERREFLRLAMTLNTVILFGGIGFLLIPARLGYPPPDKLGSFATLFHTADALNLDYNLVPSLHVALSVVCVAVFARRAERLGVVSLWLWAIAISVSTLLTHQHHVVDVLSGWIVALTVDWMFKGKKRTASRLSIRNRRLDGRSVRELFSSI